MEYDTWYEFKKDCEKRLGHPLPNRTWLQVKPKHRLPWNDRDVATVLSKMPQARHHSRR